MKSLLMIAYYFPPEGGAAVYRPLRFVRHLSRLGWRSAVITHGGRSHERYDPGLMESIPPDTDVVRVADGDLWQAVQARRAKRFEQRVQAGIARSALEAAHHRPVRSFLRSLVRRTEAWLYYPDPARFWIGPAARAAAERCQALRPDVLFVTGGPWSSFLVARKVSRLTGVPYVLDFRDSWTLTHNEDFELLRPRWAQLKDRQLLGNLFREAQSVVFRYEAEAECYWNAYPGTLRPEKIHIIPNGYEGAVEPYEVDRGDRCTLLYTGTVGPYRYATLLDALSHLQSSLPDARRLRVVFVGEGAENVERAAAARGLSEMVETMGPVPSREVARLQRQAHALLLLGVNGYQGYELCGSKVFGYLKAGRPILGILPSDESRKVLERVGVSTLADIESPKEIADLIRDVLACWKEDRLAALVPPPEQCVVYEAAHQTQALVRALEGRAPLTPFVPGSAEMPDSLKAKIGRQGWLSPA